ncbi:ribonuclease HII [Oenococcus sicerae]|uniref:Ribonuclease HII n=1 Tax=Oenococcus sicerae TaxID=2203724 RepID=A0AAJ1R9K9_9LACO|nr:ribonuclease HII [Oenococcus sicerae]MDN6899765.1 ribonuclease HII [Oenococcus sicerae]QAS70453.1 ribonuclease HII [Oenococcus sicerae]VDK14984.1 Ribonuclease HII [Oenococcus sicerae]
MKLDEIRAGFPTRFKFEKELKEKGYQVIAGIDEVGRGCIAGPVIACACILPKNFNVAETYDSKQLTKYQRHLAEEKIRQQAVAFAFGEISSVEIDHLNIYEASRKAMKNAVLQLARQADVLLVDAMQIDLDIKQLKLIHGDQLSVSISAASILAKEHRDRIMIKMAKKYPEYGFERNVGYFTRESREALLKYGITPIHRKSFAPVSNLL